jgi:hypothetical protein
MLARELNAQQEIRSGSDYSTAIQLASERELRILDFKFGIRD